MKEFKKTYIGRYGGGGGDVVGKNSRKYNFQTGPEIVYHLNSFGFRSQEILKLNNENLNILISGCSNTWGDGVFFDDMWSNQLKYLFVSKNKKINIDNISYPGASIHACIRNIMAFIENYGKPDYIFICFPSLSRNLYFSNEKNKIINCFVFDNYLMEPVKTQKEYNKSYIHENSILLATTLIYMLEEVCRANQINLIWSTWDKKDEELFNTFNFNNFVSILNLNNIDVKNNSNSFYWDLAKDGVHFGAKWHKQIANFYAKYIKNEE